LNHTLLTLPAIVIYPAAAYSQVLITSTEKQAALSLAIVHFALVRF